MDGFIDSMNMSLNKLQDRKAWCAAVHRVTKELDMTEQLNNIQLQTLKINILPFCDDFTLSL